MSKWRRERKAKDDPKQAQIAPDLPTGCREPLMLTRSEVWTISEPVMCPFCLHIGKIGEFLISTRKGFHKGLGECPECHNKMQLRSLTADWSPEQFAEWVYKYATQGYWQRVNFKKFNERLRKIGWSWKFWSKYKQLKGEAHTESYEEWLERKQREEYDESGM